MRVVEVNVEVVVEGRLWVVWVVCRWCGWCVGGVGGVWVVWAVTHTHTPHGDGIGWDRMGST